MGVSVVGSVTAGGPGRASWWRWLAGGLAVAFGVATLVEGGHTLFGGAAAREAAGNVVPFVLVFNFGAGFLYVATGLAVLAERAWAVWGARLLAVLTLAVFGALGVHVVQGGAFEGRTVAAMTVRTVFWVAQALLLPRLMSRRAAGS